MKLIIVLAAVGAFVAPAAVVADTQAPFKLTLAPAIAIVAPAQDKASFLLVNSSPASVHIAASASDGWVIPTEKSFDVAANQRVTIKAEILVP